MTNPKLSVQHFTSVEPEQHVATRARCVSSDACDDVTFFAQDKIIGVLCVPHGMGERLCMQMSLVERKHLVTYQDVVREFERALSAE